MGEGMAVRMSVALLLSLLPAVALAQQPSPACQADLSAVDDSFDETLARLDKAGKGDQAEKCAAVAHHLDVMTRGRDVFLRCLPPGHDRNENVAQLNASIADFREIQANLKCK